MHTEAQIITCATLHIIDSAKRSHPAHTIVQITIYGPPRYSFLLKIIPRAQCEFAKSKPQNRICATAHTFPQIVTYALHPLRHLAPLAEQTQKTLATSQKRQPHTRHSDQTHRIPTP